MNPFRSKYKITQVFGNNPTYYKQFGLAGHEGIDVIPTGTSWDILSLADGVVVNESDDPRSGAYGIWMTIWHPQINKATQYCHLQGNFVSPGDKVTAGQRIGTMGSTGNSTGAHLHLNLFETDSQGVRLNRTNGYAGGIDPLPFLEASPDITTTIDALQKELDKVRGERDHNWNLYQTEQKAKVELEDQLTNSNKIIKQRNEEIEEQKKKLQFADETVKGLSTSIQDLKASNLKEQENVIQLKRDLEKLKIDYDILKKQKEVNGIMTAKPSGKFALDYTDWKKWGTNALIFAGPALLVLLASVASVIPSDWRYGAVALYLVNLLTDLLRKFLAGK